MDINASDSDWIKTSLFFKCLHFWRSDLLTTSFLVRICVAQKPFNFINWLFSALYYSFLHVRSSCAKFASIISCIVVEGMIRTAPGSVFRSLGQFFQISVVPTYAVVLDTPLVCCVYFFLYCQHLQCFRAQFTSLFLRVHNFAYFRLSLRHYRARDFC